MAKAKSTEKSTENSVKNTPKSSVSAKKSVKSKDWIGCVQTKSFNYDSANYTRLYLYLYTQVKKDYTFRKKKITFIFEDGTYVTMKVRTAIINLIFWKPYCDFHKPIPVSALFDTKYISEDTVAERMDDIIAEFKHHVTIEELCKVCRHIIESLASISVNFCLKIGNTINYRDIIDLANANPTFDEILHTHYDEENLPSTKFIEEDIAAKNDIMAGIIKDTNWSALNPFLCAGGNVNMGQMSQCLVSIGPRSDIYGNISPVIVNTNFIMGLRNVSDYYLESFSQRKALIANRYSMSDSGYTSRQMDLQAIDACLSSVEDCGTEETINFFIPDKKTLNMLEFKNIEVGRNKKGPIYREINPSKDQALIGTTVKLRSPIICALEQGHYCQKCYGGLSYVNLGYHTNLLSSHSLSCPVSQTVLSTKHLNKTKTKMIKWSDKMKQFFRCETDSVYLKPELCIKGVEIGFYTEDLEEYLNLITEGSDDDEEEESSGNEVLLDYVERFVLKIGEDIVPFDTVDTELYINSDFLQKVAKSNKIEEGIIYVAMATQNHDAPVFDINIENIEIQQFLKRIMALLGVKSKTNYTTIEDLLQKLTASIVEIGIGLNFAHIESIVYSMIRDPNFIIGRPNFREKNPQYVIIPTNRSIIYSRSLTTSLAFERIGQQMKDVYTYIKSDEGFLDPFFK